MQQCMICHVADTLVSPHHTYTYRTIDANTAHTVSESKVRLSVGNCNASNAFCILIKGTRTHANDHDCVQNSRMRLHKVRLRSSV